MSDTNPNQKTPIQVLCIEDEFFISELYSNVLKKAGYDVTVEPDGQRGLEQARSDLYDIILLDLMLPSVDGTEILRTLRDPAKTPHLHSKIIVLTNLEQRPELREEVERNADGYMVKADVTPNGLVSFLSNLQVSK